MQDPRISKLAKIMVEQCLEIKPLEKINLYCSSALGLPLAREIYAQALAAGALPSLDIGDEEIAAHYYLHASDQQLQSFPKLAEYQADYFDKFVQIIAEENTSYLAGVDSAKIMSRAVLTQSIKEKKLLKPWVLTFYPTAATAQAAKMSLPQLEDFYFGTVLQDWPKISKEMTKLAARLKGKTIHLIGQDTDLILQTKGRIWNDTDWKCNMPGGEVFTSPIKESVEGHVYFNFPLTNHGVTMHDIRLTFKKGQVVKATTSNSEGQKHLEKLLATDAGSKYLGEMAIGFNPGCQRYMDNVLFDEKMAGTIHMALGESFPECGLDNRSALHLDIIKSMSGPDDLLLADDEIIMKGGKFVK